jgi:hypothetical protein
MITNSSRVSALLGIVAVGLFAISAPGFAQETQQTPLTDNIVHEGVMGCYGSTCHSRQEATGVIVRQDEILIWQDETSTTGAHARAYKTLLSDRSKNIVSRLGLGPAHEAKECVSCHSDAISKSLRAERFQFDDGVSCESCHGGAGEWLTQHYKVGSDHGLNVSRGLYPLEDAKTRANVCLSCHLGSETEGQFVNHRLMAAGHPRISFELDLFTALQSHHDEDYDYFDRKTVQTGVRIWAIGQAMALKQQLRLFGNPQLNRDGVFPELVFFDCLACHRPISDDPDWRPKARVNPGRLAAPGVVKFNDASMIMLLATARQISPELADRLDGEIKQFHASLNNSGSAVSQSAANEALMVSADELITLIDGVKFSKSQTLDILNIVVTETLTRRYTDYVAAEQAIMAVDTLLSSMIAAKQVALADVSDMRDEINVAYDAVENPNAYDQDKLTRALTILHERLQSLR